ncbi:hypothetical protein Enr10x_21190 [Gimesia panareensis]|uniref:Uncharacterized protein n=1 Tax=Gimesia panareensis TaxID=2527978 RepID=A0A517Q5B0_9PLAN|nr:hypothetical protein Enr10x_21190 [Gimesia panareensis]
MARKKSVRNQQNKTQTKTEEKTPAPSATDFLNQNLGEGFEQNSDGETEKDQTAGTEEKGPPAEPPAENPDPEPTKQTPKPKPTDQKPAKNVRETMRKPRRGDPCSVKGCPGNLISYSRKRVEKKLILYLECSACKTKPTPDKQVINYGH